MFIGINLFTVFPYFNDFKSRMMSHLLSLFVIHFYSFSWLPRAYQLTFGFIICLCFKVYSFLFQPSQTIFLLPFH